MLARSRRLTIMRDPCRCGSGSGPRRRPSGWASHCPGCGKNNPSCGRVARYSGLSCVRRGCEGSCAPLDRRPCTRPAGVRPPPTARSATRSHHRSSRPWASRSPLHSATPPPPSPGLGASHHACLDRIHPRLAVSHGAHADPIPTSHYTGDSSVVTRHAISGRSVPSGYGEPVIDWKYSPAEPPGGSAQCQLRAGRRAALGKRAHGSLQRDEDRGV